MGNMANIKSGSVGKRKRPETTETTERLKKRARSESGSGGDEPVDHEARILILESGILESKKHYNNIATLIAHAQRDGDENGTNLVAAVSLCRVFIRLQSQGALTRRKDGSEKDAVVVSWLRDRLSEYKGILQSLLRREESCSTALTLSMRLLKAEGATPTADSGEYSFPRQSLVEIVSAVITTGQAIDGLREEFVEKFVDQYEDIRFYTFKGVSDFISSWTSQGGSSGSAPFDDVFALLSSIEGAPDSNDELEEFYVDPPKKKTHALYSVAQHKKQAQDAWVRLLNLGLDREQRKKVLGVMSRVVAPWFTKPEMLMDFLTDSFNAGGSVSLLALSGVFYLMQQRNLDYPAFYTKLYSLLDADILHSKHRSKFFRLLDTFLSSSHLPSQLVASFIKKLARLCLNAPPSAIVATVPWFYNLLKKHPLCTFMLHREVRSEEERREMEEGGLGDPFLPDELDPMETKAIDSCLWEIVQLQSHYHPNVATIAKIISEQFTKQFYNLEDFLDHSYGSLLEGELSKEVKKAPVVEFQISKRILLPQDSGSGVQDSLLVKLWNFS